MKLIWTLEKLKIEALKYESRGEFQNNSNGAYQAALKKKLLDQVCAHMPKHIDQSGENHPMFKWGTKTLKEEALRYKTKDEFRKMNPKAYKSAYRRGILNTICSHMPNKTVLLGEKNPSFKWTLEKLQVEALKYETKSEFRKNNNGAYQIVKKRGLLDTICSHMPKRDVLWGTKHYNFKWTSELLQVEARKYKTRSEFQEKSNGAYHTAHKRKVLDQVCSSMPTNGGLSRPEQSLFDLIKSLYPKAQKLRDTKVKIEGKPHIQGFDIDVYIPELRKGIEFDGKYWHSFEGLKRSRSTWPDEDIHNYHEIKDSWFKSKGIELIHIPGKDWFDNKQACIDKCLDFLGIENKKVA